MEDPFINEVSREIWRSKYALRDATNQREQTIDETWQRVAHAVASVEPQAADLWSNRFRELLRGFRFLPGGRILAGAGSARQVTLFNCFVMGTVEDSMEGIFTALKEGALTMQQGGGVGYDFSTLRPKGDAAAHAGTLASGPVSFMRVWDTMCETLLSTGNRRGAMMDTPPAATINFGSQGPTQSAFLFAGPFSGRVLLWHRSHRSRATALASRPSFPSRPSRSIR